jgi:hypothetical protein
MWKPEHRRAADRTGLRYPSDLSDAEWLHSFGDPCPTGFWEVVQKSVRLPNGPPGKPDGLPD